MLAQVTWVVFETPIRVPTSQVVAYQAFIGEREHSLSLNARPLQPLNGRPVKRVSAAPTGTLRL
jgi:carbonic anhydrase